MRAIGKLPLIKSERKTVRLFGYVIYSFAGFFVFLLFIAILISVTEITESGTNKEYVAISFEDFDKLFGMNSELTDYQKKQLFNREFKGKYVVWTCELVEVSESGDDITLKCKPSTLFWDLIVRLKENQKDKLLSYKKGDLITIEGKIYSYSELFGHRLVDGEIVDLG